VVFDDDKASGPPGWMVTFGDAISLLLTFFVLLLSFSTFDPMSAAQSVISFKSVISTGEFETGANLKRLDLSSEISYEGTEFNELIEESKEEGTLELSEEEITESLRLDNENNIEFTVQELRKIINEEQIDDGIDVQTNEATLSFSITIDQGIAFRDGKASLKHTAYNYLKKMAALLRDIPNDIIITGYANEQLSCPPEELQAQQFKLAISRADKIARYLIKVANIEPARIAITGYGSQELPQIVNENDLRRAISRHNNYHWDIRWLSFNS